jgi:hypothetical protein
MRYTSVIATLHSFVHLLNDVHNTSISNYIASNERTIEE